MKKIIFISLALLLLISCSRNTEISSMLSGFNDSLNSGNGATFKSFVSKDAQDYESINDTWVLALTANKDYSYLFTKYDIPISGDPVVVIVDTTVKKSNITITGNYISKIEVTKEGGFFGMGGDWKVLSLELPDTTSNTTIPVLSVKGYKSFINSLKNKK